MKIFISIKRSEYVDTLFKSNLPSEAYIYSDRFKCYLVDSLYTYGVAGILKDKYPKIAKKLLRSSAFKTHRNYADSHQELFQGEEPLGSCELIAPEGKDYYSFQKEAILYAMQRRATLIGDEMGLGKTIEAIGVANSMPASKILVICKKIGRSSWAKHFSEWLVEPLPINFDNPSSNPEVLITSYSLLGKVSPQLQGQAWDLIIVDEAHYASNFKVVNGVFRGSQRAKIIFHLTAKASKILFLSGTFMRNSAKDLWPFLEAFDASSWESKEEFFERYCKNREDFSEELWKLKSGNNLVELQQRLSKSILIRREKTEVASFLPPKIRTVVRIDAEGDVMELLQRQEDMLGQLGYIGTDNVLDIPFGNLARVRKELGLSKVTPVLTYLNNLLEKTDKIVVFAHHTAVIDKLCQYYGGMAVKYYGATSTPQGAKVLEEFKHNPDVKIFVGNMCSAGTTITLTEASTVVFAEMSWVPDEHLQAEDRCHRIGQTHPVSIYYLILNDPIDERLLEVVTSKEEEFKLTMGTKVLQQARKMVSPSLE